MKKTLLPMIIIVCWLYSIQTYAAAELNPFAYGLYADENTNPSGSPDCVMGLHWKINATVTTMKLIIIDENEVEYEYSSYDGSAAGDYGISVTRSRMAELGIPYGQELKWRIDVTGAEVTKATEYATNYSLYHPSSVDIDNNPENPTFGTIITNEAMQEVKSLSGYISSGYGAGIYVFDPTFQPVKNGANPGFNGGITFTNNRADKATTAYSPCRIRISDDGRIFVTGQNTDGKVLWEVNPNDYNQWTEVIAGKRSTTDVNDVVNGSGTYIGGPNVSLDVRGSGNNLQLVMLSGIDNFKFKCSEYNLGTAKSWNVAPSKTYSTTGIVNYMGTNVQYDKDGGIWYCQYRDAASKKEPSLVHINANGTTDYTEEVSNRRSGAFRFNNDFTKVAIAGKDDGSNSKSVTIYNVSKNASGEPVLTQEYVITMATVGYDINDLAWDYAGNLYACGNSSEKIAVWALPHAANKVVSTPAASRYAFTIDCQPGEYYNVQVNTQNVTYGTVRGGGDHIASCETTTVFAQSKDGYKFVCWKEGNTTVSTNNPYTFVVTKDITLTAHFDEGDYNVTWYNLFQNDQDITTLLNNPNNDNTLNHRLWYLFIAALQDQYKQTITDGGTVYQKEDEKTALWVAKTVNTNMTAAAKELIDNPGSQFYWIKKYIFDKTGENFNFDSSKTKWIYLLHLFINRTKYCYNANGGSNVNAYVSNLFNNNSIPDFTNLGHPAYWRKYYTEYACSLQSTINYSTSLPISWNTIDKPTTYVTNKLDWYQWNPTAEDADKLLAWRYGDSTKLPSAQTLGPIVHNVCQDGALFATWVDKHLDENDSKVNGASNEDVIKLMKNTNHTTETDNVTVTRRLQGGMCNTICLPFDVDLSSGKLTDVNGVTYNVTAYRLTSVTDATANTPTTLNFEEVTELEAGVPYLIKPDANITADLKFTGVVRENISLETRTTNGGDKIIFHGVINPTFLNDPNTLIVVANNRLAQLSEAGEMAGLRGYFTINPTAINAEDLQEQALNGRVYLSFQKPVTTSVPIAPEAEQPTTPKVEKIMRDGQIYIIRDGVTYTITGARVR